MKVLIIHGPNMNLLGKISQKRLTLDKLNRGIRQFVRDKSVEIKIFQTHNESKAITLLQRNRNKVDALIINLGSWHPYSYAIKDTLNIINLPYRIVEDENISKEYLKISIFNLKTLIKKSDIEQAYLEAIKQLCPR